MRNTIERQSLMQCLDWCSVRTLPAEYDGKNVYIKAIGKVSKKDGTFAYVAIKKDKQGNDKIVRDFGSMSAIHKIEKIYPYLYLDALFLPVFKTAKKEERIMFLSSVYKGRSFTEMTLKELDKEVLNYAIQRNIAVSEKGNSI